MTESDAFTPPDRLDSTLERVRTHWDEMKRGENTIPFWDDLKFTILTQLCPAAMLIEVFEEPLRFRFDLLGDDLTRRYGTPFNGKFIDELDLHVPIEQLTDQCLATMNSGKPTHYHNTDAGYARLVLPLWGNGRIQMLIGAISFS